MDSAAPLMHVDWLRFFEAVKEAIERPVQFGLEQLTLASPRLVGRTTAGSGSAEQITVAAPLALSAGALSITSAALTRVNDTNVTLTLGGSPATALLAATELALGWTGTLAATRGGTGLGTYAVGDLLYASTTSALARRAIGNAADVLTVSGGLPVWAAPAASGSSTITDDTTTNATMFPVWVTANSGSVPLKVTSTKLSFNPSTGVLALATALPATSGGTGTGTTFTQGSVVFAVASGVYAQDNSNFFWDNSNKRLGIGDINLSASPQAALHIFSTAAAGQLKLDRGSGSIAMAYVLTVGNVLTITPDTTNGSRVWYRTRQADYGAVAPLTLGEAGSGYPGVGYNVTFGNLPNTYNYQIADTAYLINMGTGNRIGFNTAPSGSATASITFTEVMTLLQTGNAGFGQTSPTAVIHVKAGTAAASTAPLKFTSGTNLTTAEAGAMEYNGTNLFFTRAGTVRENVLVAIDNVAAPATNAGTPTTRYGGDTNYLGDPNRWLSVNVLGTTYKIPLYT